jgi:beta-carotene ketolase (CrtW type)
LAPLLAVSIICAWAGSIWYAFFHLPTGILPDSLSAVAMIAWIQFLYCGMFIVTHDACHGTAWPGNPRMNRWLGRLAAGLYAAFDFDRLVPEHAAHHHHVASSKDPDFHDQSPRGENFLRWGWRFFRQYMTFRQILIMMAIAQIFFHVLKIPDRNVIQFWVVPAVLSGVQLFFFGTWLPHRSVGGDPFPDRHHARDSGFPWLLSLISCWHFGYHHAHHTHPGLPWFRLPAHRSKK